MKRFYTILTIVCASFAIYDAVIWSVNASNPVWITVLMFLGSILLLFTNIRKIKNRTLLTILALLLICVSSFLNSFYTGNIVILQHVVRVVISIFVVYLSTKKTAVG
ncbi:hypothetical protein EDD76_11633 [Kineothrix alysoides]|uniref:Uncharacterized protein n=1 Tax=Kineothrix alysoides TaxID=1469948 RepID=A0A4R1QQM0_9FIRM|nr:hypothetical protein EDD76_11633 [Kineothrix alysoides]